MKASRISLIALGAAVIGLYGCAPVRAPMQLNSGVSEQGYVDISPVLANPSAVAGYVCPQSPNVNPYQDNFDFLDEFTVCTQASSAANFSVTGRLSSPSVSKICAFPANVINGTQVATVIDPSSGLPAYNCETVKSNGPTFFSFSGLTFNSVYIVEYQNLTQMQQCLLQNNGGVCPNYSFGQISSN